MSRRQGGRRPATRHRPRAAPTSGALQLSADDREHLILLLDDSLADGTPEEIEAAWIEEVKRRIADIDSGKTTLVPWESTRQMMAEVLERARTHRTR